MGFYDGFTGWMKGSSTLDGSEQGFDYQDQLKRNERNRAIATALMNNGQNFQGQMVSGHYVAPSGLGALAKIASVVLGAKMFNDSEATDKALRQQATQSIDRELEGFARKKNPNYQPEPTNVPGIASEAEKNDILRMFRPDEPGQPAPSQVTVSPSQNAPTPSVSANKKAIAAKALRGPQIDYSQVPTVDATTPQQVIQPTVQPGTAMGNTSAGLARPYMGSGTGFAAAPSPAAVGAGGGRGVVNPALVDPRAPTPQAKKAVAAVLQGKPVPTTRAPVNAAPVVNPTQSDADFLAAARAGAGRHVDGSQVQPLPQEPEYVPTSQIEQLRAISRISQMGPEGQFLANHLYNQQFGKDGGEYDVKDGFMFNKRTGQWTRIKDEDTNKVLETKDTPDGLMERTAGGWRLARTTDGSPIRGAEALKIEKDAAERQKAKESLLLTADEAARRLKVLLDDKQLLLQAKGDMSNAVAAKFSSVTGQATDTSVARTKISDAMSAALNALLEMKRAAGVVSAGQLNSDADVRLFKQYIGEIDNNFHSLDLPTLIAKLTAASNLVDNVRAAAGGQPLEQTPQQGSGLRSGSR